MRFALLLVALCATGCSCSNERSYREALKQYEALITARTPLQNPAYDEVLQKLDLISTGDEVGQKARQLAEAIRTLRSPQKLPPRPLAVDSDGAAGAPQDDVDRKARECAELAKALGLSRDGGHRAAMGELARCRIDLEKLNIARIHAQDPLGHSAAGPPRHDGG